MEQKDNEFQQHTRRQQYWENQRNSQRPPHPSANVLPPNQINANGNGNSKTIEDYQTWMCGKCYGCGSTKHLKATGHHKRDQCRHCGCLSHQDLVCQAKFMGKGPQTVNQVAANTSNTASNAKDNKDQMIEKLQKELENL